MSPRGVQILTDVDIIAAEDTRRSMVLPASFEIRNKLVSNHKFNEYGKAKYFINEMKAGKSVAVITDAGTPCISDPGNELIKAEVEEGYASSASPAAARGERAGDIGLRPVELPVLRIFPARERRPAQAA